MHFSLIIPTRCRPKRLELMIDSVFDTTTDKKNIEIVLGIDDDDELSREAIEKIKLKYTNENISVHSRLRGNSVVKHYLNWMALNFCSGKYFVVLNDDCLFRYKNWDVLVYKRLEEYLSDKPDGIVLGIIEDLEADPTGNRRKNLFLVTDFPLLSKRTVEVLGFFLDPAFFDAGSDTDICRCFYELGRVVNLKDICRVQHKPPEFDGLQVHPRNGTMRVVAYRGISPSSYEIDPRVTKLKKYIIEHQND